MKIKLKLLLFFNLKKNVIRLLYQYKHFNFVDFSNLPKIDFIVYRIRLTFEIKFHSVDQKRWLLHKK